MPTRTGCRSPRWSSKFSIVAHAQGTATTCTSSRTTDACVLDRAKKAAAILCKGGVSFHFRAHDLRRTAASYMGEAGVDRFHIAHVLNHRSVTHSTVTAIYDRYRYDKEKRAALETWAGVLTSIVGRPARAAKAVSVPAPTDALTAHRLESRRRAADRSRVVPFTAKSRPNPAAASPA